MGRRNGEKYGMQNLCHVIASAAAAAAPSINEKQKHETRSSLQKATNIGCIENDIALCLKLTPYTWLSVYWLAVNIPGPGTPAP
jgi:hypothetical protein